MDFKPKTARESLIVALDVPTVEQASEIVGNLGDTVSFYKIGMQLQFAGGLSFAEKLTQQGKGVFLDVKLLDIDNTVAHGVENIAKMGVKLATIHAYPKAMRAAISGRGDAPLGLLGVTVLTNFNNSDLETIGYKYDVAALVKKRALDARKAGMTGIVCSPAEAKEMRACLGPDMIIVTPGIRPAEAEANDQKRIATPAAAIRDGADYLVVGRPILNAANRKDAATAIIEEIAAAQSV